MTTLSAERQQTMDLAQESDDTAKTKLRLWLRILKVSRQVEGELRERLRTEFDTTLPRFDVMAALYRSGDGLKMSALSQVLRVSNGNVTGIVDRLVAEGLIARVPVAHDRRAMIVRLTEKGRGSFETLARAHAGWVRDLLEHVSVGEATEITEILGQVTDRAGPRKPSNKQVK